MEITSNRNVVQVKVNVVSVSVVFFPVLHTQSGVSISCCCSVCSGGRGEEEEEEVSFGSKSLSK